MVTEDRVNEPIHPYEILSLRVDYPHKPSQLAGLDSRSYDCLVLTRITVLASKKLSLNKLRAWRRNV